MANHIISINRRTLNNEILSQTTDIRFTCSCDVRFCSAFFRLSEHRGGQKAIFDTVFGVRLRFNGKFGAAEHSDIKHDIVNGFIIKHNKFVCRSFIVACTVHRAAFLFCARRRASAADRRERSDMQSVGGAERL